eukprot:872771-Amphidinium_carterae.1
MQDLSPGCTLSHLVVHNFVGDKSSEGLGARASWVGRLDPSRKDESSAGPSEILAGATHSE